MKLKEVKEDVSPTPCQQSRDSCFEEMEKEPKVMDRFCSSCSSDGLYSPSWSHPLSGIIYCQDPWWGFPIPGTTRSRPTEWVEPECPEWSQEKSRAKKLALASVTEEKQEGALAFDPTNAEMILCFLVSLRLLQRQGLTLAWQPQKLLFAPTSLSELQKDPFLSAFTICVLDPSLLSPRTSESTAGNKEADWTTVDLFLEFSFNMMQKEKIKQQRRREEEEEKDRKDKKKENTSFDKEKRSKKL